MRLFLAVDLPEEIKKSLYEQLDPLRKLYPDFAWVSPENYHITVNFFGDVSQPKKLVEKIKDVLYDQRGFYLYSLETDLFIKDKITVYVGFRREKNLEELAGKINDALQIKDERKFIPHLTVARYRVPSKQQYFVIKKRLGKMNLDFEFPVKKVILFESTFAGRKPIYKKLSTIPLL